MNLIVNSQILQMKYSLLFAIVLFMSSVLSAQIVSGDKLTGNIVTTDINGKAVDIFADLDAGKTVVIDVFATWCGPCWSFHGTKYLENLNAQYGPDGTNQIRVYGIEGDSRTPEGHLYQAVAATSTVPSSLGDWTEGVDYSIINSHSFNTILNIAFFPTLYVIRPDRTVMEMGDYRYNDEVWAKAMIPTAAKDLIFSNTLEDRTFCSTAIFNQKPKVINMGTTGITSIDAELVLNGEATLATFAKTVGVFQETEISFGNKSLTEPTDIEVNITGIDGVADEDDALSNLSATYVKPLAEEKKLIVKFTTDFYPGETSWTLKDNKNRTLKTVQYAEGNEDQFGGGGPDAVTTHEYEIDITNIDINCLTLTINDSYGDGMTAFNSSNHPVPGVEFYSSNGTLLKGKLRNEYYFLSASVGSTPSSVKVFAAASIVSGLEEQDFVENLNVFPNPVTDILNIDMNIKSGTEYEVLVTNLMGATMGKIAKNTNFINVAQLPSGMYFLNVKTKDGLFAHKFTKI